MGDPFNSSTDSK